MFQVYAAADSGRCHRYRARRPVLQRGGYPELPPAHERPDQRIWNTLGPLQRPPPSLQVHRRSQRVPSGSHPVRPRHGGTGNSADFRQITPGQGPGRTRRGHLPGPSGNRVQAVRSSTIDEANEVLRSFLSRFNQKFGVQAEESTPAYRPLDPSLSLEHVLCFKHSRKVARDNTVKYNTRTLQLLPGSNCCLVRIAPATPDCRWKYTRTWKA